LLKTMLAVINYNLGNLRSICAAMDRLDVDYCCTSDPTIISSATSLILPGVGSFPDGMRNLHELQLVEVLQNLVLGKKVPILGICLGFQLMADWGFEFGSNSGLGWIRAKVSRFDDLGKSFRVPHVGWNDCVRVKDSPLFNEVPHEALFYFTHSYCMTCDDLDDVVAYSDHGSSFVAGIQKENIFGTQFHPEKSQLHGLTLLRNFVTLAVNKC
jgi:glutamine amidotransferase